MQVFSTGCKDFLGAHHLVGNLSDYISVDKAN